MVRVDRGQRTVAPCITTPLPRDDARPGKQYTKPSCDLPANFCQCCGPHHCVKGDCEAGTKDGERGFTNAVTRQALYRRNHCVKDSSSSEDVPRQDNQFSTSRPAKEKQRREVIIHAVEGDVLRTVFTQVHGQDLGYMAELVCEWCKANCTLQSGAQRARGSTRTEPWGVECWLRTNGGYSRHPTRMLFEVGFECSRNDIFTAFNRTLQERLDLNSGAGQPWSGSRQRISQHDP